MMSFDLCPLNLNDTVTTFSNITWAQASDQPIKHFDGPSYLRPDIGKFFSLTQHTTTKTRLPC